MDTCQEMVDRLSECTTDQTLQKFESTYVPQKLSFMLKNFDDDFYGGRSPGAADVSLFNVLNLFQRANIVGWKTDFPELYDHYNTVSKMGLIPKYLESTKDVPLGF